MKKVFTLLSLICVMFGAKSTNAQSISSQHDTVWLNSLTTFDAINDINNLTSGNVTCQWRVTHTNFPADWIATLGICDNASCYSSADIWPTNMKTSLPYAPGLGDFHVQGDLTSVATPGPYYLRVHIRNKDITTDTSIQIYIITKAAPAGTNNITKLNNEVMLYPNPATSSVNIVFDAAADVKNIAIYNIIGKQMNVYRPTANSANLNVENLPDGIYFVRLLNSHGDVVSTRKFTKQ